MTIKYGQALTDVLPFPDPTIWEFLELTPARHSNPDGSIQWTLEPSNPQVILKVRNVVSHKLTKGNKVPLRLDECREVGSDKIYETVIPCYGDTIIGAAIIIEAVGGLLDAGDDDWKMFNFSNTDANGKPMTSSQLKEDVAYWNSASTGLCQVLDKTYYPLRARYQGTEHYFNLYGDIKYRQRGDLMENDEGEPLYIKRRQLRKTLTFVNYAGMTHSICGIPARDDLQFGRDSSEFRYYTDSPLLYEVDRRVASFNERIILNEGAYSPSLPTTTDPAEAEIDCDICYSTRAVRGEYIPPGTICEIRRHTQHTEYYPKRNEDGDATEDQLSTCYEMYDVNPTWDTKLVQIAGQCRTNYRMFNIEFYDENGDKNPYLKMVTVNSNSTEPCDKYGGTQTYVRCLCTSQEGKPDIVYTDKLVRESKLEPCRGIFYDGNMPVPCQIDCQMGFGIPLTINDVQLQEKQRIFHRVDRIEIRKNKFAILVRPQYPYLPARAISDYAQFGTTVVNQ